jgi:acyl-CoA synthetase (AMP-forming)/AMP-acid ligase II
VRVDGTGVGEILISGPQLSPGWWGDSLDMRTDRWHRTGDLGFLHDGHLFVLGRTDDAVIFHGRNFYLSDVVAACGEVPMLRPGRLAPFVATDAQSGLDVVHIVAELRPEAATTASELARIASQTKRRLVSALELFVSGVHFVSAGQLPTTTSGKVRASEVRRRFEAGNLPLLNGPGPA